MMPSDAGSSEHIRYRELASLAAAGALDTAESRELRDHLADCEECRGILSEYEFLVSEAIPVLAQDYDHRPADFFWDQNANRRKLLSTIQKKKPREFAGSPRLDLRYLTGSRSIAVLALVASVFVVIATAAWQFRELDQERRELDAMRRNLYDAREAERAARLADQTERHSVSDLKNALERGEIEIARIRHNGQLLVNQLSNKLESARKELENSRRAGASQQEQLLRATVERDQLASQLHAAQNELDNVQSQLADLRNNRQKRFDFALSASKRAAELEAADEDLRRRLADAEKYLSADRDVRELMGARNLYIADVFDVDSASRTRQPFGRVFYTKDKSLIFYAFDLDRQHRIRNASFQAWGEKEVAGGQSSQALNLGILYLDNESKRRWALRFDDPQKLAEIDAVFVTVEPYGGSRKPTGKPFLFATLRRNVNHP